VISNTRSRRKLRPAEESSSVFESSHSAPAEAKTKSVEEPKSKIAAEQLKVLSPLQETELSEVPKSAAITPKRRMASILDTVIEFVKASTPALAPDTEGEALKKSSKAIMAQTTAEAGSSVPVEARSPEVAKEGTETRPSEAAGAPLMLEKEGAGEESESPAPGAPTEELEFIVRHASGKKLSKEQIAEAQHYARDLKYPRGSLVYSGDDKDEFLYCLSDNKEIHVCREMADNVGYPKLELGLSAMTKDQLTNSLAYKSLKVRIF
jgi:hypothetical protein